MGHEIAHADLRHSSDQLKRQFGLQILTSIIFGQSNNQIAEVAQQVATTGAALKFSRDDEADADEYSVIYLTDTDFACNGAAAFFQKLLDNEQAAGVPEFLSTHPSPDNRVEAINEKANQVDCSTELIVQTGMTYQDFINSLP